MLVIVGFALASVMSNKGFEWPVVGRYMFNGQVPAGFARTLELTVIAMVIGLALGAALANIVEASIRVKHMRPAAARPRACSVCPGTSAPGISSPS